jgi:UDP-2-acetamido-2,6-beta-L-arabino-hexul-4-ose reductase
MWISKAFNYKKYNWREIKMRILIAGATGFIGKNMIDKLKVSDIPELSIYSVDSMTSKDDINEYTKNCDFVFNFAAIHRPKDTADFEKVNHLFFQNLLNSLEKHHNCCPVLYTSSIQATNGSEYAISKKLAEESLRRHGKQMDSRAIIYRLTNTFGRWARPNGHSVTATFCYNVQRGLPIIINNPDYPMQFYYIDDVIDSFIQRIFDVPPFNDDRFYHLPEELLCRVTLGELAEHLNRFKGCDEKKVAPELNTLFEHKL